MRSFVVGVEGRNAKREKMPHCKLCGVSKYVCAELFAEDFKECLLRIAINTNSAESTNVFFHLVLHGSARLNFAVLNGLAGMKKWC